MSLPTTFTYTTVTGYFLQDDNATVAENFDFISTNFGLIERDYQSDSSHDGQGEKKTQWERFQREVARLNQQGEQGTVYKVLFIGRHGQGVHNVAERRYGTAEWDRYWAAQEGDSIAQWVDPHLTETGIHQAETVHAFWKHQLAVAKTPAPESYYSSPLYRCLETANLTFADLDLPAGRPYQPVVKEVCLLSVSP
ncbi:MAG: hypothetical protein L6R40_002356 [Gallowayella cf. fulva]|nr:MAG: hypothetical protein L6R40_002356 [Xanthomendoza cf. fulva]